VLTVVRRYVTEHPGCYAATVGEPFRGEDDPFLHAAARLLGSLAAVLGGYGISTANTDHAARTVRCLAGERWGRRAQRLSPQQISGKPMAVLILAGEPANRQVQAAIGDPSRLGRGGQHPLVDSQVHCRQGQRRRLLGSPAEVVQPRNAALAGGGRPVAGGLGRSTER